MNSTPLLLAAIVGAGTLGCAVPPPLEPEPVGVAPVLSGLSADLARVASDARQAVVAVTNHRQLLRPAGDYARGLGERALGLLQPFPAYWEYPLRVLALPAYLVFGPFDLGTTHGTAFFVTPELLVSNAHVVHNASTLAGRLADGREVTLTIEEVDPDLDLALLRVEPGSVPPGVLRLRPEAAVAGEVVCALGYPQKPSLDQRPLSEGGQPPTLTVGVLSVAGLELGGDCRYLETDATLNPGNSGGPLLDLAGDVVGVCTLVSRGSARASYAIPVRVVSDRFPGVLAEQDRR